LVSVIFVTLKVVDGALGAAPALWTILAHKAASNIRRLALPKNDLFRSRIIFTPASFVKQALGMRLSQKTITSFSNRHIKQIRKRSFARYGGEKNLALLFGQTHTQNDVF
jgi:hypothetical protein